MDSPRWVRWVAMSCIAGLSLWLGVIPGVQAIATKRYEGQVEFYRQAPVIVIEGRAAVGHGMKLVF